MLDDLPLSRKQIESIVVSSQYRISIWTGAVRSGKTVASLVAFLIVVASAPNTGLLIMSGRTLQTIERNLIEPLQNSTLFGPLASMVQHTRGSSTATILGRTVHLIGAADVRAEEKLRGLTAYAILLDEATLLPEEFITQALARLSVPGARCLMTTNPAGPRHPLRQKYLLRANELNLCWWKFSLDDNPALPPEYVAAIKREFTGLFYRRMVDGDWVLSTGVVYDMFDDARHVVAEVPELRSVLALGVDYGATNPTHAVVLGLARDGRVVVTREYRHDPVKSMRALTIDEVTDELGDWLVPDRPNVCAVDPSAKALKVQMARDPRFKGLRDADNAVLDGILLVASLLSTDMLVIHESCTFLIDELGSYAWDDKAAQRGDDKPLKVNDHAADALRYAVISSQSWWRRGLESRVDSPAGSPRLPTRSGASSPTSRPAGVSAPSLPRRAGAGRR